MGVSSSSSSSSSAELFGVFPFTFISAVSMGKSMVITLILVVSLSLFNFHVSSAKRTILIGDRRMLPSCTDCHRYTSDPTCCHLPHHPNCHHSWRKWSIPHHSKNQWRSISHQMRNQ